jgi:hypothetical protein
MYLFKLTNPKNRNLSQNQKPKVIKELIPVRDQPEGQPSLPDVDVGQLGSGTKGIKNKLKSLNIHSNNAKKKYDKFISLKL